MNLLSLSFIYGELRTIDSSATVGLMENVLVVGFSENKSAKIALRFSNNYTIKLVDSTEKSISAFVQQHDPLSYDHIVAIGIYSGRDISDIRIETVFNNKFRNKRIGTRSVQGYVPGKVPPGFKLGTGCGTSWCNLLSYSIVSAHQSLRYNFLHVPRSMSGDIATSRIAQLLAQIDRQLLK